MRVGFIRDSTTERVSIINALLLPLAKPCVGHFEKVPYNDKELRSVYHIREYDVEKLMHVSHFIARYPVANPIPVNTKS